VVALRADIDALPVTERNDLSFKSTVKGDFMGEEVGVMHACGHDTHMAILMGVATVLSKTKTRLKGLLNSFSTSRRRSTSGRRRRRLSYG